MFWEEDEDKSIPYKIPDEIIDVLFDIQCKRLPVDHIQALSHQVCEILPWLQNEPQAGIHDIHVAESGNGWMRPEADTESSYNALLHPSRRTKFILRIPKTRYEDAATLTEQTIDLNGYPLTFGKRKQKMLTNASVIFARYIICREDEDEPAFLQRMSDNIYELAGIKIKKMMCGTSATIKLDDKKLATRHLMIADLDSDPSIKLQQHGLGSHHLLGCGLFLPHKGIKTLKPTE